MKNHVLFGIVMMIVLFIACSDAFEFSPNQIFDKDTPFDLNAKNLQRLNSLVRDDTITIAFVGDSQRFYDELQAFIDTVNALPDVDFVLLAGDISDFGLLEEFELITEKLERLNKPYIGVVGNHDVVARGEEIFKHVFGPLDFSFTYGGVKFIVHNTNSKEFNNGKVPDLLWLQSELVKQDSVKYFVAVSHVPPFSEDFDQQLEGQYTSLFQETPSFLVSLHAHVHDHTDGYPYSDGVRYITSYSFDQKSFVLLKIFQGQVNKHILSY